MAKKREPIKTTAYIHVGDKLVDTRDLNPAQKDYLGAMLQMTLFNLAYKGIAEFTVDLPPVDEVFPKDV